jgi:hypothetical protein
MEVCRSKKLQAENSNWPGDMDYSGLAISELQTAPYETGLQTREAQSMASTCILQCCKGLSLVPITPAGAAKKQLQAHRGADAPQRSHVIVCGDRTLRLHLYCNTVCNVLKTTAYA